jgi:hypothetical protein
MPLARLLPAAPSAIDHPDPAIPARILKKIIAIAIIKNGKNGNDQNFDRLLLR